MQCNDQFGVKVGVKSTQICDGTGHCIDYEDEHNCSKPRFFCWVHNRGKDITFSMANFEARQAHRVDNGWLIVCIRWPWLCIIKYIDQPFLYLRVYHCYQRYVFDILCPFVYSEIHVTNISPLAFNWPCRIYMFFLAFKLSYHRYVPPIIWAIIYVKKIGSALF